MKVELIISKDRVPYIIEQMGEDRVNVSGYNEDSDTVKFELQSQMDVLYMFHAGIKCGSDTMITAWQK
jgi:hypothetical protein